MRMVVDCLSLVNEEYLYCISSQVVQVDGG